MRWNESQKLKKTELTKCNKLKKPELTKCSSHAYFRHIFFVALFSTRRCRGLGRYCAWLRLWLFENWFFSKDEKACFDLVLVHAAAECGGGGGRGGGGETRSRSGRGFIQSNA